MAGDASLDDFVDADAEPPETDDGEAPETGGRDDEPPSGAGTDEATTTPAQVAATYQWSPDGTACESCGSDADRRWRDDGAMVCADCKEW